MNRLFLRERPQSAGEEIANSITHSLGLLAALIATPLLILTSIRTGNTAGIIGVTIFAVTLILVYFTSILYHAWPYSRTKDIFQIFDHGAIFLLIAGTYTPFTLGALNGPWGWTLLVSEWALAIFGVTLNCIFGVRHRKIEICLYLLMGWLA